MVDFLAGASVIAAAAIALFFLRFWRDSGDRFFAFFAAAFAIMAGNRVALTIVDDASESRPLLYVVRALAFALIIVAIVDKNRDAG